MRPLSATSGRSSRARPGQEPLDGPGIEHRIEGIEGTARAKAADTAARHSPPPAEQGRGAYAPGADRRHTLPPSAPRSARPRPSPPWWQRCVGTYSPSMPALRQRRHIALQHKRLIADRYTDRLAWSITASLGVPNAACQARTASRPLRAGRHAESPSGCIDWE